MQNVLWKGTLNFVEYVEYMLKIFILLHVCLLPSAQFTLRYMHMTHVLSLKLLHIASEAIVRNIDN